MSLGMKSGESSIRAVACSGASNAGEFADHVVRKLRETGDATMDCLTKIAIGDSALIEKLKTSGGNTLAVDGCSIHCAKKILEAAGITGFKHVTMTDLGVEKGATAVTNEAVERIAAVVGSQIEVRS